MCLRRKLVWVINPIDGLYGDDALLQILCLAESERQGHCHHNHHFQPKSIVFHHPDNMWLGLDCFRQVFGVNRACLDLDLHNHFVEGYRVLVILPNWLEIVLKNDCNAAHHRGSKYDKIRKKTLATLGKATIRSSLLKCSLPMHDCQTKSSHSEEGNEKVQVLPVAVIKIVLSDKLTANRLVRVLNKKFI